MLSLSKFMLFASLISRLFDPMIGFFLLFGIAAYRSGVFGWDLISLMITFLAIVILPPAVLLFFAVKTKRISNWDISNRRQRVWALLVYGLLLFGDYFFMQSIFTPLMKQLFVFFLYFYFVFFLITLRYKISGHMMMGTLIILFYISWYGWILAPLFLIIPLLGWSRLVLKRHTLGEVITGSLYAVVIFFIATQFGLL